MRIMPVKTDGISTLPAEEFNEYAAEVGSIASQRGIVLAEGTSNQLIQSLKKASALGSYFIDTGTANAIILQKVVPATTGYRDGMRVRFLKNTTNTNSLVTLSVNSEPPVELLDVGNNPIIPGRLVGGNYYLADYSAIQGKFILNNGLGIYTGNLNGVRGERGDAGAAGATGAAGTVGLPGIRGLPGPQGLIGPNGLSDIGAFVVLNVSTILNSSYANTTIQAVCNTSNDITFTLPSLASFTVGTYVSIIVKNTSGNRYGLIVNPVSGEQIEGISTYPMFSNGSSVTLVRDPQRWLVYSHSDNGTVVYAEGISGTAANTSNSFTTKQMVTGQILLGSQQGILDWVSPGSLTIVPRIPGYYTAWVSMARSGNPAPYAVGDAGVAYSFKQFSFASRNGSWFHAHASPFGESPKGLGNNVYMNGTTDYFSVGMVTNGDSGGSYPTYAEIQANFREQALTVIMNRRAL